MGDLMITLPGILFISSIVLLLLLIVFRNRIPNHDMIDMKLLLVMVSFGILLLSIYFGSSDLFYGFDTPSEVNHVLDTYRTGYFRFTLSAFSNTLSLVLVIPLYLEITGINILVFYKVVYPLMLVLYIAYYYALFRSVKYTYSEFIPLLVLALSTYAYIYGFVSSMKYGVSFLSVLTIYLLLCKGIDSSSKYMFLIVLSFATITLYYTVGLLYIVLLAISILLSFIKVNNFSLLTKRYLIHIFVLSMIVAFIYWFYYAQATQQHLIDALKHLIYSSSERVETKASFISVNTGTILPKIGTYIKILTLLSLFTLSSLGLLFSRKEKTELLNISRSAFLSLAPALVTIGFILGLYLTMHFYWWSIPILSYYTIHYLREKMLKIQKLFTTFFVLLIILNMFNQLLITNKLFQMKGSEIVDKVLFNYNAPTSLDTREYRGIITLIKLSKKYLVILPDAFSVPLFYQVLALNIDLRDKIYISRSLKYPLILEKNTYVYISSLDLRDHAFYIPIGGYGTPIPLNEIMNETSRSIVFNNGISLLVKWGS